MPFDSRFPLESCSRRLRSAILAEFGGRCPTVRQIIARPITQWRAVPGIGPLTLRELHQILQALLAKEEDRPYAGWAEDELMIRRDRLRREIDTLRADIEAIMVELMRRTAIPSPVRQARGADEIRIR